MASEDIARLCDQIRETAYAIHVFHGNGYLEKVYENALVHRLRNAGIQVTQQHAITIQDEDGTTIGEYTADLVVSNTILIELKSCKTLTHEHESQILHYLAATHIEHGILINFGSYKFQIKKFILTPPSPLDTEDQPQKSTEST